MKTERTSSRGFRKALAALAIGAAVTVSASAAELQAIDTGAVCPSTLSGFAGSPGLIVGCWCPGDRAAGTVWGSGPYTADSSVCTAARHAGLIGADGGEIWAQMAPGEEAYHGSSHHNVRTSAYGQYGASYNLFSRSSSKTRVEACPSTAKDVKTELNCLCSADKFANSRVWGMDVYTSDSGICEAALHAGVVSRRGGNVTLRAVDGQQSYTGSERNGVATSDYGPWGGSFLFVRE